MSTPTPPYGRDRDRDRGSGSGPGSGYQPPYGQGPDSGYRPPYTPVPPPGSGPPPAGPPNRPPGGPAARRVNGVRLWVGGLATALVAALAAVVCVLLVRGVLHVPVFAPRGQGAWGNLTTGGLALAVVVATLAATLLMHLLLLAAPQPGIFFAWIITLATIAVVLLAFTTSARLSSQIGSAAVYAVAGLAIGCLLSAVGRSAARGPAAADYRG